MYECWSLSGLGACGSIGVAELGVVVVEVEVVYVTEECILDILAVEVVLVGVERDIDVATSAG